MSQATETSSLESDDAGGEDMDRKRGAMRGHQGHAAVLCALHEAQVAVQAALVSSLQEEMFKVHTVAGASFEAVTQHAQETGRRCAVVMARQRTMHRKRTIDMADELERLRAQAADHDALVGRLKAENKKLATDLSLANELISVQKSRIETQDGIISDLECRLKNCEGELDIFTEFVCDK